MIKFRNGDKVMVDHWCLQPRLDGKRGRYGILPIYGYKRRICIIECNLGEFVLLVPIGSNYSIKVKAEDIMEYDPKNTKLEKLGNTMYDNRITVLSDN